MLVLFKGYTMLDFDDEQRMVVSSLRDIVKKEFEKTASDWNGQMP